MSDDGTVTDPQTELGSNIGALPMGSRSYLLASMLAASTFISTCAGAAPVLWSSAVGGNDHYYDYHYTYATFDEDRVAARSSSFMGMQGYLATVTSAAENTFISTFVNPSEGFLGGADEAQEGTWRWLDGPEAGGVFFSTSGGHLDYTYNNWNPGEPNDGGFHGPENALELNTGGPGGWNDTKNGQPLGIGYFIEYGDSLPGGVPEPATWAMMIAGFGLVGAGMRHRLRDALLSLA